MNLGDQQVTFRLGEDTRGTRDFSDYATTMAKGLRLGLILAVAAVGLSLVYGVHLGVPARPPLFGSGLVCYGGYQWHNLRRAAVEHLVEATRPGQPIVEYFHRTLVPDEALVQTVLVNAGRFRLLDDTRRFADTHERPGGHARFLDMADAAACTDGRHDFARRFDATLSRDLLDWLDAEVHGLRARPLRYGPAAGAPIPPCDPVASGHPVTASGR
mgnify:CR=1 FL=1